MKYRLSAATILVATTAISSVTAEVKVCNNMLYGLYVKNVGCGGSNIETATFFLNPSACTQYDYSPRECGTSVKLSKSGDFSQAQFQFEYTDHGRGSSPEMFADFSDVDGSCAGKPGSAFLDAHVIATAEGVGADTCPTLKCMAGQVCQAAYRHSTDDSKTRNCGVRPDRWIVELQDPNGSNNVQQPSEEQHPGAHEIANYIDGDGNKVVVNEWEEVEDA